MTPTPDPDRLLRDRLDRAAERIDPRPLFDRIMAATPGPTVRPRRWSWRSAAAGFVTAAAVGFLVVGGLPSIPPASAATAEELVRQARQTHHQPLDRCYLVESRRESELFDETGPMTAASRTNRLWTRGDRFWIEGTEPGRRWAWGRDERGGFWLAFGGLRKGVRVDPDESPKWLDRACDVLSMQLETVLGDVLRDFDLVREPAENGTRIITATLKAGHTHPGLRAARLEIDGETKAVRKLVLHRTRLGQPVAVVTYTLVETGAQDDAKYQLAGHLPPGADVYTRDREPARRTDLLVRWFGAIAARSPVEKK